MIEVPTERWADGWRDALVIAQREALNYRRDRALLISVLALPTLALLIFDGVLGNALESTVSSELAARGISYSDYVVPGIAMIIVAYSAREAAHSISIDAVTGQLERYRSLPVRPLSVLGGRILTVSMRNTLMAAWLMVIAGLLGFDFDAAPIEYVWAWLLLILASATFAWLGLVVGLSSSSGKATTSLMALVLLPMSMISSALVSVDLLPGWTQPLARVQPITTYADGLRILLIPGYPSENPIAVDLGAAVGWFALSTALLAPLAIRRFERRSLQ